MSRSLNKKELDRLIQSFSKIEPPFSSLGTPFLADTEETMAVVSMGPDAVPSLIEALGDEDPKVVMYAAYCLGGIGDRSALNALEKTKERHSNKDPKEEYDFGVISATTQAIDRILGLK